MIGFNPYLNFRNNCRQALEFYKECFNGEISQMQTVGESGMPASAEQKDLIVHSIFKAGSIFFMASDSMDHAWSPGTNVTLNINFDNPQLQEKTFDKLSRGGNVTLPLQDTFWGARFGMLTDKFGINWMMNCEIKK